MDLYNPVLKNYKKKKYKIYKKTHNKGIWIPTGKVQYA